ncbi:MAG: AlkZ family DNA glycosylase [Myxococcales bacterium]|nr:AlkZ family DNA glycosylase [Myxococcales bacterium]MCB9734714.1 AlkZ family DNA glycosylase [Deltaproteobacteria bacterium]
MSHPVTTLTPDEARAYLIGQTGLRASRPAGEDAARALLRELRCIQLDPLDVIGTNADLVAMARLDGLRRGDLYRHLFPGGGFEHFAKERCLLPPEAFPYYRDQAVATPWWRSGDRQRRLPEGILERVLHEVRAHGPLTTADLSDHGAVEPIDWSGWKGTAKAASMAIEVLWTRCQVVTCGRSGGRQRLYDVPERQLATHAAEAEGDFVRWALRERVEAAGLLSRAGGPWWSTLYNDRNGPVPDELLAAGELELVVVAGKRREYLAPAGFRDRVFPEDDGRMRILGPLDPLIWDRALVKHAFGFDYVWEVYKPAEKRRWGWYVCPLLHEGRLVGRFEPAVEDGRVVAKNLWKEKGVKFSKRAFDAALARHSRLL